MLSTAPFAYRVDNLAIDHCEATLKWRTPSVEWLKITLESTYLLTHQTFFPNLVHSKTLTHPIKILEIPNFAVSLI